MIYTTFTNTKKPDQLMHELKDLEIQVLIDIRYSTQYPRYFSPSNLQLIESKITEMK